MKQITTKAIILRRVEFGEADRILTLLTLNHGKIRVIAKGVRKMKSKLAGGLELLSLSDVTYIHGRSDIYTLVSSRLDIHYTDIVKDLDRTMLAYELMKKIDKLTEDSAGQEYFELLCRSLNGINFADLDREVLELWFNLRLLRITGHTPNLNEDTTGNKLSPDHEYNFDPDDMTFAKAAAGRYSANHIKFLRIADKTADPLKLVNVSGVDRYISDLLKLSKSMLVRHIRL